MDMLPKSSDIFDREHEWDDLCRFVTDDSPGLRLGVVRGRRRHGKSFLLEHLCRAVDGVYTLALRQSRAMALARFADSVSRAVGYRLGRFDDWPAALDSAIDALSSARRAHPVLLVVDEFPYLAAGAPELPSAIQALYDQRGPATGHPAVRVILCGSGISVMSTLLAGDQALRGRAVLDLRVGPFRFRDAGAYWQCDPATAFLVDAVLGGAPGYRDLVGAAPKAGPSGYFAWLERSLLNPSHALFAEPDYLLAEDPRVGDRAIYHSIWEAVSNGATTPTQIGGLVGMDAKSLTYHLRIMREGGFIRYDQDILLQRRPVIRVADPAVRFHNLVVRPNLLDLEMRNIRAVWDRSQETFSRMIVGPHFEELAREWVRWYGPEAGLDDIGHVGSTVVSCREHRGHEVDVVALGRDSRPRSRGARITVLGEAKSTNQRLTTSDIQRLRHILGLLAAHGYDVKDTAFALFSRTGFSAELVKAASATQTHLIDLPTMYGKPQPSHPKTCL
jgi:AAA+ ATPase superfamily predicted ATPase